MSGVPPQSFDKVEDPEIRDIIERCIRLNKEERPSIKQLLGFEFFAEDTGFKLELLNREHLVSNQESMIKFRLKVTDQRKLRREKPAHKENEAIEFDFNLESDNCMEVSIYPFWFLFNKTKWTLAVAWPLAWPSSLS